MEQGDNLKYWKRKGQEKKKKMTKTLNVAFTPHWSTEMFLFGGKLRGNVLEEALSLWLRG